MCDCRSKNEARLLEAIPEQLPEGATNIGVRLQGYALMLGDGVMTSRQIMPFEVTYQVTTKAGVVKDKKQTISLTANYCMFCGEKYAKDEAA